MTVAIARVVPKESLMLSPVEIPMNRSGETRGAQITTGQSPTFVDETSPAAAPGETDITRNRWLQKQACPMFRAVKLPEPLVAHDAQTSPLVSHPSAHRLPQTRSLPAQREHKGRGR